MSLFKHNPRSVAPPESPNQATDAAVRTPVSVRRDRWFAEPEAYLAGASAATIAILGGVFAASRLFVVPLEVLAPAGWVLQVLYPFSWAATIGVGLTSRSKSFRLLGWCTAAGAGGLYMWQRATGAPSHTLFGMTGLLASGMYIGTLIAWWLCRRPRDVA